MGQCGRFLHTRLIPHNMHVSGTCSRCILAKLRVAERKEVSTSNMQGAKISTVLHFGQVVFTVFEQIDLIWVHFFELFLSLFMWDETAILFQNTCKLCVSQIGEGECKNAGSVFNPAVFHRLGQRLKPCSQSLEDFAWDLQPGALSQQEDLWFYKNMFWVKCSKSNCSVHVCKYDTAITLG